MSSERKDREAGNARTQIWTISSLKMVLSLILCQLSIMSNYVPHYTKKKQILSRKQSELRRLIQSGGSESEVISAAMAVRDAQVRALQARRAVIMPMGNLHDRYERIDRQIHDASSQSIETIIACCQSPSNSG